MAENPIKAPIKALTGTFTQMFGAVAELYGGSDERPDHLAEYARSAAMEAQNAVAARMRGGIAAGRRRMAGSALGGTQKVAYAMGGIDASSGTAAQTSSSSAIFAELDAQTISNNAVREAFGHEESARKYRREAQKIKDDLARDDARKAMKFAGNLVQMYGSVASALGGGGR